MGEVSRDEFLYRKIKSNRSLYFGLAIVYCLAALAAFIMAIAAFLRGRPEGSVALAVMGIGFIRFIFSSWAQYKGYAAALEEIGPNPQGVDTCRTYSPSTAAAIARSRITAKELGQQWIAYGLVGVMMVGMGIFLVVLLLDSDPETVLMLLGVGLAIGGVVLLVMASKAFSSWRIAKQLGDE